MSIQDLIAARGASLTPTERRIATVVLDDPTRLAFGTAADLAHLAQTSAPSVVRFAAKLGFDGYSALQSWAQEGVSRQLSSPSERIRHHDERAALRAGVESAVSRVFEALSPERLATLAAPIAQARNVYILTGETSTAGARVLHSGLSMIRPSVTLVMEHSTGRDLAGAARGDACIVFDFARYRRSSVTSARTLSEIGVDLVAITDGPLSPLAELTPHWCELRIPAVGPFDSSVPAVIAAELLVAQTAEELGETTHDRIHQLEQVWRDSQTYL